MKDPHLSALGGGQFDFRGKERTYFVLWTASHCQVNGMTKERMFKRMGGQIIGGTFFVLIAFKVAVDDDKTVRAQVVAEQPGSFRLYGNDDATGPYVNRTSVELPSAGLLLAITPKQNELIMLAHDLEMRVKWGQLRMPLTTAGQPVPKNDHSRWYLDTSFSVRNATVPAVAPHGLIGQSADGAKMTVHGKRDNYGRGRFFKTSAQGEGAIEGVYTDYIVAGPFATAFKFARFGVQTPVAPRDVSALTGRHEPKKNGVTAGSTEDE